MGYQGEYRFFTESWKQIKTAEYGEQARPAGRE